MDQNVYAYTDTVSPYPGFVSLNVTPMGEYHLSVRAPFSQHPACLPIGKDQLLALAEAIRRHLGVK